MIKNDVEQQLLLEYSKYAELGFHRSLLDANFYSIHYFFPDEYVQLKQKKMLIASEIAELIPGNWSENDSENLRFQMEHEVISYKDEHWSKVSSSYLSKHCFGFGFLDDYAFAHYLAAWAFKCLSGELEDAEPTSFYLFCHLHAKLQKMEKLGNYSNGIRNGALFIFLSWLNESDLGLQNEVEPCLPFFKKI